MVEIIPSIIASDFTEVKAKLSRLEGLVNWAELDVMDGVFVPNHTWQTADDLNEIDGKTKISAHLMVEYPETIVEDWQEVADRIVLHYESTNDLNKIIDNIGPHVGLAIALDLRTPVEKIYEYLGKIKTVQLMSIVRTGFSGEKFDERVFEKIRTLKTNWPDVKIIVDGGINLENGKKLIEAGASGLVVGSQIWGAPSVEEAIKKFQAL